MKSANHCWQVLSLLLLVLLFGCSDDEKETITGSTQKNLPAPSNLAATASSSNQINLTWTDNSNAEDGFKIERTTGGTGSFAVIATMAANATNYQNTGLTAATNYTYRMFAYNTAGNSEYSNSATATTQAAVTPTPAISVSTVSNGTFTISVSFSSWPSLMSNQDRYEIEESTVSNTSGFTNIHTSGNTHTSPYTVTLTRNAGTYYYRARIYCGVASIGFSPYSTIATVVVAAQARQITLTNNMSSGQFLQDIVQVKVSATQSGQFKRADLLTADPAHCLSLPGESISRGSSRTFNITIGNDYFVFIGIGKWETDLIFCSTSSPWFKRTSTTTTDWVDHWVWVAVHVTGHTSGNSKWNIYGNYSTYSLYVKVENNTPIPFNITTTNPIP